MKQVSVREAQHHLARVLAPVADGEEIEIARRNAVVARIVPDTGQARTRSRRRALDFRNR